MVLIFPEPDANLMLHKLCNNVSKLDRFKRKLIANKLFVTLVLFVYDEKIKLSRAINLPIEVILPTVKYSTIVTKSMWSISYGWITLS